MASNALVPFSILLVHSSLSYSSTPCDSILRDGTMAKSDYRTNTTLRRLLHYRFANQDVEKSNNDESFGGSIPIGDVLVGTDFSKSEQSEAQHAIRSSLDMELIRN